MQRFDERAVLDSGEPLIGRFLVYDALRPAVLDFRRETSAMNGDDMTVAELKERIDRGDAPVIVDVREPSEFDICRIPGAVLIPLGQLPTRLHELDRSKEIVLQCKVGGRSALATTLLRAAGFSRARNLKGGILAWIEQVDPSQPKY